MVIREMTLQTDSLLGGPSGNIRIFYWMRTCRVLLWSLCFWVAAALPVRAADSALVAADSGEGHFFSRTPFGFTFNSDQIRRSDAPTLAELLAILPGISVHRSSLVGGAEELRWHGTKLQRIAVLLDGVPFGANDLCWPSAGRWSPASFSRVSVCVGPGRGGPSELRLELESFQSAPTPPLTDAFWQTGPFEENLLDVLFARKLSRKFSLFFHSRSLSTESRDYTHPDVITTFYESIGRDSARIMREGINQSQSVREIRAGGQYDLGYGSIAAVFSSYRSADSLFSESPLNWERRQELGYYAFNYQRIGTPLGLWSAGYYQGPEENGLWLVDSIVLGRTRFLAGGEKVFASDSGQTPARLWGNSHTQWGPVAWIAFGEIGMEGGELEYGTRQSVGLDYPFAFAQADLAYSVAFPQASLTYAGIPLLRSRSAKDTLAQFSIQAGAQWRGFRLWLRQEETRRGGMPMLALAGHVNPPAAGATTFGLDRFDIGPIRFGEELTLNRNGWPEISNHLWASYIRMAVQNRLLIETALMADYTGRNAAADLQNRQWVELDPFWDVSLRIALQIRTFRLFYKIGNLFDSRRAYFYPYPLPGLNFQWGLHWALKG